MKQLLVMQKAITREQLEKEHFEEMTPQFDPDQLPSLSRHQDIFYDEMHLDQEGGSVMHSKYQIRFPRDASGRYSPPSATNPNPIYALLKPKPSLKFTQQVRFCLGCGAVELTDGTIVGRGILVFDYSAQRLISIGEYKRRKQ